MSRSPRAHHQERQTLSTQPLVTVTLCWWPWNLCVALVLYQESLHDAGQQNVKSHQKLAYDTGSRNKKTSANGTKEVGLLTET
jgi:hypothetical protein